MKMKLILLLICTVFIHNSRLRKQDQKDIKELDPLTVKSPGGFDNVAPEAKKIITPSYAGPKVDVSLNIRSTGLVSRTVDLGSVNDQKVIATATTVNIQ